MIVIFLNQKGCVVNVSGDRLTFRLILLTLICESELTEATWDDVHFDFT